MPLTEIGDGYRSSVSDMLSLRCLLNIHVEAADGQMGLEFRKVQAGDQKNLGVFSIQIKSKAIRLEEITKGIKVDEKSRGPKTEPRTLWY